VKPGKYAKCTFHHIVVWPVVASCYKHFDIQEDVTSIKGVNYALISCHSYSGISTVMLERDSHMW